MLEPEGFCVLLLGVQIQVFHSTRIICIIITRAVERKSGPGARSGLEFFKIP